MYCLIFWVCCGPFVCVLDKEDLKKKSTVQQEYCSLRQKIANMFNLLFIFCKNVCLEAITIKVTATRIRWRPTYMQFMGLMPRNRESKMSTPINRLTHIFLNWCLKYGCQTLMWKNKIRVKNMVWLRKSLLLVSPDLQILILWVKLSELCPYLRMRLNNQLSLSLGFNILLLSKQAIKIILKQFKIQVHSWRRN